MKNAFMLAAIVEMGIISRLQKIPTSIKGKEKIKPSTPVNAPDRAWEGTKKASKLLIHQLLNNRTAPVILGWFKLVASIVRQ